MLVDLSSTHGDMPGLDVSRGQGLGYAQALLRIDVEMESRLHFWVWRGFVVLTHQVWS